MKADAQGTPVEQARARMGWMTTTEARIAGIARNRRCSTCCSARLNFSTDGDGALVLSVRCVHTEAGGIEGHATRLSCTCKRWDTKA
jgi:hypothetical protein